MNIDKVNSWLSLIANLGVLLGVFLVAFELQQNRQATQSQTRAEIAFSSAQDQWNWIEYSDLLEARSKYNNCEEVSAQQRRQLGRALRAQFRRWENTNYQYEQGLYDDDEFQGQIYTWSRIMETRLAREIWEGSKNSYSASFINLVDRLYEEATPNLLC